MRGCVNLLVHPSFCLLSVPCHFLTTKNAIFEGEKFINNTAKNDTMSGNEEVASYAPHGTSYKTFYCFKSKLTKNEFHFSVI